jgi:hypothetical protein
MSNAGPFDPSGLAAAALRTVVDTQGPRVLQHTSQLRSAFGAFNIEVPRESGILLLAADAGVAGMLTQQVTQQGVDPAGAIRLSAGQLGQRTSLDPDACIWATTAFAEALGLLPPQSTDQGTSTPWVEETGLPPGIPPGLTPAGGGWSEQTLAADPTSGWTGQQPAADPAAGGWPGQVPAPGWGAPATTESWAAPGTAPPSSWGTSLPAAGWPTGQGGASSPGAGSWGGDGTGGSGGQHKPLLIGMAIVVAVLILGYFGAAAGAHLPPFSKSSSTAAVSTTTTPPTTTAPATTTTTTPPSTTTSVAPFTAQSKTVAQLMPADIPQTTDCQSFTPPVTGLVGLDAALECLDPSLTGGIIFGLQFGSPADYASSVTAVNTWLGFDTATAGQSCPPTSGTQGAAPWSDAGFPQLSGQSVECLTVGTTNATPALAWFYPSQDVILDAQGGANSSLLSLTTWWTDHADAAGAS